MRRLVTTLLYERREIDDCVVNDHTGLIKSAIWLIEICSKKLQDVRTKPILKDWKVADELTNLHVRYAVPDDEACSIVENVC